MVVGCNRSSIKLDETKIVPSSKSTPLANISNESPKYLGNTISREQYEIPFYLEEVPQNPRLAIRFKVASKGTCPVTYMPSTISINGAVVANFDFRKLSVNEEKKVIVHIPKERLEKGKNLLIFNNGGCKYGIDSMHMDDLSLLQ